MPEFKFEPLRPGEKGGGFLAKFADPFHQEDGEYLRCKYKILTFDPNEKVNITVYNSPKGPKSICLVGDGMSYESLEFVKKIAHLFIEQLMK